MGHNLADQKVNQLQFRYIRTHCVSFKKCIIKSISKPWYNIWHSFGMITELI